MCIDNRQRPNLTYKSISTVETIKHNLALKYPEKTKCLRIHSLLALKVPNES